MGYSNSTIKWYRTDIIMNSSLSGMFPEKEFSKTFCDPTSRKNGDGEFEKHIYLVVEDFDQDNCLQSEHKTNGNFNENLLKKLLP